MVHGTHGDVTRAKADAALSGAKPTKTTTPAHSLTGRLITLACASIKALALAASTTAAWVASSSLRQVVPWRFTKGSQPTVATQASKRSAGTPCFL